MRLFKTVAASGLATTASIGLMFLAPTEVAEAAAVCKDKSRDAAAKAAQSPDMREIEIVFSDGTIGKAQITLRHSASNKCAWGLLEGQGVIWMERRSPHGTIDRIGERRLEEDSITHTVALDLTLGSVRACGQGFNGSESTNSGASVSVSGSVSDRGSTGSVSGSGSSGSSTVRSLAAVVCTNWIE